MSAKINQKSPQISAMQQEQEQKTDLANQLKAAKQVVVVCFGTTAISGDALGPMVGSLLVTKYDVAAFVYGTETHTINGKNMQEWIEFLGKVHEGATFVGVDASLGNKQSVGKIVLRNDGVCPAAINGAKKRFGDVGVLGVVAENKGDAMMQLMSVSTLYVSKLADKVAQCINDAIQSL